MNEKIKTLIKCVAIPLLLGAFVGAVTKNDVTAFQSLPQPPLMPPQIVFPIVWTILYALMGYSFYKVKTSLAHKEIIAKAVPIYYYQLVVNLLWPILFFNLELYLFSFIWLLVLWLLVLRMIRRFYHIEPFAAYLNIPYFIWLTFAAYLNFGVWWLNH